MNKEITSISNRFCIIINNWKQVNLGPNQFLETLAPKIEVLSKRCEWFVLQERLQEPELNPRKKRGKENWRPKNDLLIIRYICNKMNSILLLALLANVMKLSYGLNSYQLPWSIPSFQSQWLDNYFILSYSVNMLKKQ
jgi:hypothetical protein